MSDEFAPLPAWVRRRDGSQEPFDPDRICQSLFAAAEALGTANAFLIRELTDVVLHFLAQADLGPAPATVQIKEHVEKIVREVGQPGLARCYAERESKSLIIGERDPKCVNISCGQGPSEFTANCFEAYARNAIYSRDVGAALREGLVRIRGSAHPAALASLVLSTPRLAELPWWPVLDDWRAMGGSQWIVESPEWLGAGHAHPAMTPHLCERLLALPTLGPRPVELHVNIAEPPAWSQSQAVRPLFGPVQEDETSQQERSNFLDSLLERWKSLPGAGLPALAMHVHEQTFRAESQRRQLHDLLRQALQGKPIRFVFDRPRMPIALAEGLDSKCPGVIAEIGLDLHVLTEQGGAALDVSSMLKKVSSLARIAVSAANQVRQYLRGLPEAALVRQGFLLDRASAVVTPLHLTEAVRVLTGASVMKSSVALDCAVRILRTLRATLEQAGRPINLDLRLEVSTDSSNGIAPAEQMEVAGKLHAAAGAGTMTLFLAEDDRANVDHLVELMQRALRATSVVRLQVRRAGAAVQQGELPIEVS